MELGLIYDLSREYRLSALRLHLHPFEGRSVSLAELVTHHYPVESAGALADFSLFAALQYRLSVVHTRGVCLPPLARFP